MVLPRFKVLACAVVQLFPTIGATCNAGEQICLSRPRRAAFVLPQFLHPFPCVIVNNGFVSVLKHKLFFFGIVELLFGFVGLLVGLKIYRMPQVIFLLQNRRHGIGYPTIRIIRYGLIGGFSLRLPVGSGSKYLVRFQNAGNLRRTVTL